MRLLDLFCGAGGAAMGYHRAGFDVVGVDIAPQPNYPFEFHRADAMTYPLESFDAVHASPPCQSYSRMSQSRAGLADTYPRLVGPVRERLAEYGAPYVIENVRGSDVRPDVVLCGAMFGLALYRHRLFESNVALWQYAHLRHRVRASRAGHYEPGTIISVAGNCAPVKMAREAMGIDWTTRRELAEAIPPAYTEFLGEQLADAVTRAAARPAALAAGP